MFEFAISQHKKRVPTKRFIASWVLSCLAHTAALLALILFPGLLRPGRHLWFNLPSYVQTPPQEDSKWRTAGYIGGSARMQMPSAATLRKYLARGHDTGSSRGMPPIRIKWGDEQLASRGNTRKSVPALQPAPGTQDPKPVPETEAATKLPLPPVPQEPGTRPGEQPKPGTDLAGTPTAEKKGTVFLPAPSAGGPKQIPKKVTDTAQTTPPVEVSPVPEKPGAPPQVKEAPKVFENKESAIRSQESGFFDTKGFPLGEYATMIIERIKGNWSIPSNLRSSQGRSTVIFYIEKNGQVLDARIVSTSGNLSLDLAALSSVTQSSPLPPLPRGFPGDHIGAKFVFAYNERQ